MLIGIKGCGYDWELTIHKDTGKAYLLSMPDDEEKFWLPISAFESDGELKEWGRKMLQDKIDSGDYAGGNDGD